LEGRLYAVKEQHGWSWSAALEISMDSVYRFEKKNGAGSGAILLLEPVLSWGQVCVLRDALKARRSERLGRREVQDIIQRTSIRYGFGSLLEGRLRFGEWSGAGRELASQDGIEPELYRRFIGGLRGRSLLPEELFSMLEHEGLEEVKSRWKQYVQWGILHGKLRVERGMVDAQNRDGWLKRTLRSLEGSGKPRLQCRRCGSERLRYTSCPHCRGECPYCEDCLGMGRVRFCSTLISGIGEKRTEPAGTGLESLSDYIDPWGLSDAQRAAVIEGMSKVDVAGGASDAVRHLLIWAVTGAGKTEMLFPFIAKELAKGGRVLIASPRRDVVLELQPRLAKAFDGVSIVTLHATSEQRWEEGRITLSTAHQLLRYEQAFELVVIDEVDAFPYHNNPMLQYAASKVCKPGGTYVFLTATPPKELQRMLRSGRIPHVKVPARYHRHPLPVPENVLGKPLSYIVARSVLPNAVRTRLEQSLHRDAQLFVFVPYIKQVEPMVKLLRKHFSGVNIQGTSSQDPERGEKVLQFRDRRIRILVTTTILERGVTVPKSDVFILGADSGMFDEGALVQMAGRAGRSKDDPAGKVYFVSAERTKAQAGAIGQIRSMNRIAKNEGYLI
jgi:competence protein ComFA